MINNLLSKLRPFNGNTIYELLSYQPHLRLCVDVGAAAGLMTQKIWKQANNSTRIVAIEPFEGNHAYFLKNTEAFRHQVQLVKKAASSQTGTATLCVPFVVQGTEKNWENYVGYSSTGYIEGSYHSTPVGNTGRVVTVETITINELIQDHIDFMKIDVQGHEHHVLQGASNLLCQGKIDVMYIEFDGDQNVLDLLQEYNYIVFDTTYSVILRPDTDLSALKHYGFHSFAPPVNLSTGVLAVVAKRNLPLDEDYCQFFKRCHREQGYVWTDLVAISPQFIDRFMVNLGRWIARVKPQPCTPAVSRQRYPAYWDSRQ
jgi:FkbM family methyltransferase